MSDNTVTIEPGDSASQAAEPVSVAAPNVSSMTAAEPPDPPAESVTPSVAGQPHDGLFKGILGKPEHAASELRSILPAGLASRLDLDQLEQVDGSFVDQALRQQHTDVLFRARLDQGDALIYVLLEHQSTPDRWMALRMCGYLTRIWTRHLELHPGVRRLPPIIPIVVYQGRAPWSPPLDLIDLIGTDDDTVGFAPRFSYLLDDLHRLGVEELRSRPLTHAVRLSFVLMREAPGSEHLTRVLPDWRTDLEAVRRSDLVILWTYALIVSNTPEPELTEFLAQLGPEAKEVAMTTADVLRAEGEARGRAAGRADTLLEQLDIKFSDVPADIEQKVRTAPTSQLEIWTRRILTANTIDAIFT